MIGLTGTIDRGSDRPRFRETALIQLIVEILKHTYPAATLVVDAAIGRADGRVLRPDILLLVDDTVNVIEVKREAPQTINRLEAVRIQLMHYTAAAAIEFRGRSIKTILAIPGVLSAEKLRMLGQSQISVWDQDALLARAEAVGLLEATTRLLFHGEPVPPRKKTGEILLDELHSLPPGRDDWSAYQKWSRRTFEFLFCPPLSPPIEESTNESRVNRRDFVMPNYADAGLWQFLRVHYRADYIIADAKNLKGNLGKGHILQICNYMTVHGTGLFGVIVTRNGLDSAAHYTRKEQWVLHSKMLIVLNDDDMAQMLGNRDIGDDPGGVVRQKIEDFRLGM